MFPTPQIFAPGNRRLAWPAGFFLVLAFVALYLLTLDNGLRPGELEGGDLITHQYAQVQGRFSNAPGYPLYTMGGWLWFRAARLLTGSTANPMPLLSSYSTLWALVALALLYALILRVTRRNWLVACLATTFYGLTYFFWYYAVTTEQYTSSVAWTLAVTLLAFRWQKQRRESDLCGIALLMGIGLAHQVTVLAILPPLLWFIWRTEPEVLRKPAMLLRLLLLALAPLLSYAYVYLRGAQHPEWRGAGAWETTLDWFLAFISTGQGRGELTWTLQPFLTAEFPALIWRELTWPGLVAGLAGIATLGKPRAALLYATLAVYIVFCWVDRLGNWYQVIMPVYALLTVGLGAGADWVLRRGAGTISQTAPARRRLVTGGVLIALIALVIHRGVLSYPRANSRDRIDDTGLAPGWAILADEPPAFMPILGTQDEALSLSYLTQIWGLRPDLTAVTSAQARALAPHAVIGVTEAALPLARAEVNREARYSALGRTLARMQSGPDTQIAAGIQLWEYAFGGHLKLLGGVLKQNIATKESVVILSWLATAPPAFDWSVSVRLLQDGAEIGQADSQSPVHGAYPMTRWLPGEVVNDAYAFSLPATAEPDEITVILYRQDAGNFINLDAPSFRLAP